MITIQPRLRRGLNQDAAKHSAVYGLSRIALDDANAAGLFQVRIRESVDNAKKA